MKSFKIVMSLLVVCSIFLAACGSEDLTSPPEAKLLTKNYTNDTKLGSYCWEVDGKEQCKEANKDLEKSLEDETQILVTAGTPITVSIDTKDKPTKAEITQILDGEKTTKELGSATFNTVSKEGIIYYSFKAYWDGSGKEGFKGYAEYQFKTSNQF